MSRKFGPRPLKAIGVLLWLIIITGIADITVGPLQIHERSEKPTIKSDKSILGDGAGAFNPDNSFNRTYGGSDYDTVYQVIECEDGGYAIIGATASFGIGSNDVWLVRTSYTGQMIWSRTYGGSSNDVGRGILELSDGGFAVIAETESFGAGQMDFWLIRTDSNGNHLWNRTYGGSFRDHGFSILEHNDGGFVLMGMTTSFGGADKDMWLVHTDSAGNHLWNYTYGGGQLDEGLSMVKCSDGGFAISGYSDQTGNREVWLVRTDSDGTLLWERYHGLTHRERGEAIVQLSDGGFLIAGNTEDAGTGASDMWLLRTNSTGHLEWNRIHAGIGNDYGYAVIERDDGGFAVAGFTNSSGAGNQDAWLMFTNETGHHMWNQTYGGPDYDNSVSLVQTTGGSYLLVGQTWSYGMGNGDIWMVVLPRINWDGTPTGQDSEFGFVFRYDLNATSPAGIQRWWLNDSIHFVIDDDGVITSIAHLGSVNSTHGITVYVNDTVGNELSAAFSVTITPDVSRPSWLEAPSDQHVEFGEQFIYDLNATDPSGLNHWWIDDTMRFTVDWAGRIRSIEPLSIGPYGLTVYVSDIYGHVLMAQFTVWVQDTHAPSWSIAPSNQILEWDECLSYQLAAFDASGIDMWTLDNTDSFSISATGLVTNKTTLSPGTYVVTVSVSDPYGNILTDTFTITVRSAHEPTTTEPISPLFLSGILVSGIALGIVLALILSLYLGRKRSSD
jgi:hypothetical protein